MLFNGRSNLVLVMCQIRSLKNNIYKNIISQPFCVLACVSAVLIANQNKHCVDNSSNNRKQEKFLNVLKDLNPRLIILELTFSFSFRRVWLGSWIQGQPPRQLLLWLHHHPDCWSILVIQDWVQADLGHCLPGFLNSNSADTRRRQRRRSGTTFGRASLPPHVIYQLCRPDHLRLFFFGWAWMWISVKDILARQTDDEF